MRSALLIGSGIFRDPRLLPLPAVERDVAALGEVLADPLRGGYAVKERFNTDASRLRAAIEDLLLGAGRQDEILVFISGHGFLDQDGQLFFATTDTDLDRGLSSAVEARLLATLMRRSPAAAVVVLLDCCHSGAFGFKSPAVLSESSFPVGRGRAVLTATTATELAWEGKRISIGSGLSVFTHHVVAGIRTGAADIDADGQITIHDLFQYVRSAMAGQRELQAPTLIADQLEAFPVIAHAARDDGAQSRPAQMESDSPPPAAASRFRPSRFTLRHPFPIEFVPFGGSGPVAAGHVSRTPVTEAQLALFLGAASRTHDRRFEPHQPATNVSWFLAEEFCHWLAEEARLAVALPTEQEFAAYTSPTARAGRSAEFSDTLWEWCANWAAEDPAPPADGFRDARPATAGLRKVVASRTATDAPVRRGLLFPRFWYRNVGFRVTAR